MDDEDGLGAFGDRGFDTGRIDVVGVLSDIDEHRHRPAVANRIRRGDERVADGNHFVAGAHAKCEQREMERCRAARDRAGMGRADGGGKLALERRDLRALRHPP
jgi:hypothetical protein